MRGERGQATVELVLVLPLIAMLVLGIAQLSVVIAAQVRVVDASRAAARAAAVDADPAAAARAVAAAGLVGPAASVQVTRHDGMVTAEVRFRVPARVPLVGTWFNDTSLTARTAMREESRLAGIPP
jgi:Flp pilus assembly protein TadG